jgi:hypothetical protein
MVIKKKGLKMANNTITLEIVPIWIDLTTNAPLADGSKYVIQNIGGNHIFLFEGDTMPDQTEIGLVLDRHDYLALIQKDLATKFWVRGGSESNNRIVLSLVA